MSRGCGKKLDGLSNKLLPWCALRTVPLRCSSLILREAKQGGGVSWKVAYIGAPRSLEEDDVVIDTAAQLDGHAVLVAIACNEIIMQKKTSIGLANVDEPTLDPLVTDMYRNIANARLQLPLPVAMAMIDPAKAVYRVNTDDGIFYLEQSELDKLLATENVVAKTLSPKGEAANLSSEELAEFRLIKNVVDSRSQLAQILDVPINVLEGDPSLRGEWKPIQLTIPDYIDQKSIDWVTRALNASDANLVIFRMDSIGGEPDACLRMATRIAEYDPNEVRTVAFVSKHVMGAPTLIALSCDHLIMNANSELGGASNPPVDEVWLSRAREDIARVARVKERDRALLVGLLDPNLKVSRYREQETGQVRVLTREDWEALPDPPAWKLVGPLSTDEGITANQAEALGIARSIIDDMDGVQAFYQLDSPPRELMPTRTDRWLQKLAKLLASPMVAPWLLFGAVLLLSTEMSAPGLGVPGFLGTLCLIAFFWSQHLDGNAHWLEIMLFIVGVIFVLMEIFVIPGFGIFGVGGIIMVVVSIVLASQTFIIPTTAAELNRLPYSLGMVLAAGMGFVVSMIALRKVLPNTPYFRRMMLEPPKSRAETGLETEKDPDAVVDWSHLLGNEGEAITPLVPSGKARIDGEVYDVITEGRLVEKGQVIVVVEAVANRIVVRAK